jgi:hypothetical protein
MWKTGRRERKMIWRITVENVKELTAIFVQ